MWPTNAVAIMGGSALGFGWHDGHCATRLFLLIERKKLDEQRAEWQTAFERVQRNHFKIHNNVNEMWSFAEEKTTRPKGVPSPRENFYKTLHIGLAFI